MPKKQPSSAGNTIFASHRHITIILKKLRTEIYESKFEKAPETLLFILRQMEMLILDADSVEERMVENGGD